jgi:hypothetical protein
VFPKNTIVLDASLYKKLEHLHEEIEILVSRPPTDGLGLWGCNKKTNCLRIKGCKEVG